MGFEPHDVLVTDESMVGDFSLFPEEIVRAGEELGIEISSTDYIWQVAERLIELLVDKN